MIIAFIAFLKNIFRSPTLHNELEAHIVAGNPLTAGDVERLERGFYQRYQRETLWN
jgi:hypothetical protein